MVALCQYLMVAVGPSGWLGVGAVAVSDSKLSHVPSFSVYEDLSFCAELDEA